MELTEFFCGAGLATLGLARAGFTPRLSVDWDPLAVRAHKMNFPGATVLLRDLFACWADDVLREQGIGPDWRGLCWLSPPCQSFSSAGVRDADDERSTLLGSAVDAARALPNAWVVVENVVGLTSRSHEREYNRVKDALSSRRRGAFVKWVLDAKEFGVAQERPRIFLVGAPAGYGPGDLPRKPAPRAGDVPLRAAIGDAARPLWVDEDAEFRPLLPREYLIYEGMRPGGNWQDSARGRKYAKDFKLRKGTWPPDNWLARLSWDKPSPCLMASLESGRSRLAHVHPAVPRLLSVGERKELMSLPREYVLLGDLESRGKQAGNGVVVRVAEAVGRSILAAAGFRA